MIAAVFAAAQASMAEGATFRPLAGISHFVDRWPDNSRANIEQ
jgi:hypothetical protein